MQDLLSLATIILLMTYWKEENKRSELESSWVYQHHSSLIGKIMTL